MERNEKERNDLARNEKEWSSGKFNRVERSERNGVEKSGDEGNYMDWSGGT